MILKDKQINELLDKLTPLGCSSFTDCTTYHNHVMNSICILYKNNRCLFEYRSGMNGYSLIQSSPASILTDGITSNNYQLHYFNNNTFDIDVIVNVIQKYIGALEKQNKEDKVRNKKKDLEKDFEELN